MKNQEETYLLENGITTINRPTEIEALRMLEISNWQIKNKFFVNEKERKLIAVEQVLINYFNVQPTSTVPVLARVFGISDVTCEKLLLLVDWKLDVDYQLNGYLF